MSGKNVDRYMEFLDSPTLTPALDGAGTGVETVAIRLPTSKTEMLAFLLHKVMFEPSGSCYPMVDDTESQLHLALCYNDYAATPYYGSVHGVIAMHRQNASSGQVSGALSDYVYYWKTPEIQDFSPPILIATDVLSLCLRLIGSIAVSGRVRLGYTLEKVGREAFIAALVH